MITAATFSRQNDAVSRAYATYYWANLVPVVVLVLESKSLYYSAGKKWREKKKKGGDPNLPSFSPPAIWLRSPPSERHALQSQRPEEASTTAHRQLMGLHWLGLLEWDRTFSEFEGSENSGW